MLLTNARAVPDIALACLLSFFAAKVNLPSFSSIATSECKGKDNSPFLPLITNASVPNFTSTPAGTVTGFFATRDIYFSPLGYDAQQLTTDTLRTGFAISHYTFRSTNNSDTQAIHYARDLT